MTVIDNLLYQRIVSVVQPICLKSGESYYTVDQLYRQIIQIVAEMIQHYGDGDYDETYEAKKKMLIGDKGTILDALTALQNIALKRKELVYKYKLNDESHAHEKKITKDDLEIIEEFIKRLPEAYAHEQTEKSD